MRHIEGCRRGQARHQTDRTRAIRMTPISTRNREPVSNVMYGCLSSE